MDQQHTAIARYFGFVGYAGRHEGDSVFAGLIPLFVDLKGHIAGKAETQGMENTAGYRLKFCFLKA